ncbi:YwaF family protein [Salibacterium lacus]|uniref:TIGR02206 family membrane protein n=1 Tax=Salibacterium lacus TaxID=1898109 RepID=A0ABW5T4C9_9BACI
MWWWKFSHEGPSFTWMGPAHLMVFLTMAVLCVLFIIFRRRLRHTKADLFIKTLFPAVFLLGELSYQVFLISNGAWDASHSLPLQLSSFVWITAVLSFFTSRRIWFEITFFAGASSALLTILTPDLADYGFPHYRFFHFFITHGLVVAAVCYMVVVEKRKLYCSSIFRTWGVLNLYLVSVACVNLLTGGNYMYIMEKPVQTTLFDWLGAWPYYLLSLEVVALAVFSGMYYVYNIIRSCRSIRLKQKR